MIMEFASHSLRVSPPTTYKQTEISESALISTDFSTKIFGFPFLSSHLNIFPR